MGTIRLYLLLPAFLAAQYVPHGHFQDAGAPRETGRPTALSMHLAEIANDAPGLMPSRFAERGVRIRPDGTVTLHAYVKGDDAAVRSALAVRGAQILRAHTNIIEFTVPPSGIAALSDIPGVHIREPLRPYPLAIEGENVVLTKASNMQTNGWRGQNVKVGIIDGGFWSNTQAIAAGELPSAVITRDFTGTGFEASADGKHGTAVAEVVHEMAPLAQLYLCKVSSSLQLKDAIDYCKAQGVQIINHSMGWFGDGTGKGDGYTAWLVDKAAADGILWVNSAGNHAQRHWMGMYTDNNGDTYHDFSGSVNVNQIGTLASGASIKVFLTWDDAWGMSGNDYALSVVRWNGSSWVTFATGNEVQNGDDFPSEAVITSASGVTTAYGFVVRKVSGSARTLKVYCLNSDIQYQTAAGSVTTPADAKGAFAVGAIDYLNWTAGPQESYSSQGPTSDGRIKPEICGVDNNTNLMQGRFQGTSSAAPCVAGAAAVLWSAYQTCAARDVWNALMHYARDLGAAGMDSIYGAGAVDITVFKRYAAINNAYRGVGDVIFDGTPLGSTVSIYSIAGKFVAAVTAVDATGSTHWNVRNPGGQKVMPGVYYCTVKFPDGSTRTERLMIVRSRID